MLVAGGIGVNVEAPRPRVRTPDAEQMRSPALATLDTRTQPAHDRSAAARSGFVSRKVTPVQDTRTLALISPA